MEFLKPFDPISIFEEFLYNHLVKESNILRMVLLLMPPAADRLSGQRSSTQNN